MATMMAQKMQMAQAGLQTRSVAPKVGAVRVSAADSPDPRHCHMY